MLYYELNSSLRIFSISDRTILSNLATGVVPRCHRARREDGVDDNYAFEVAIGAVARYGVETVTAYQQIAMEIIYTFKSRYGGNWNCIVLRRGNGASYVVPHESDHYAHFSLGGGQLEIELFE